MSLTAAERQQRPILIGISGKARAGKDTLAWMLIDALRPAGIDARRYGWADALKAVCRVEYGMRGKDAPLLQRIGVHYREGYVHAGYKGEPTPDVWVNTLLDAISEDAPQVALIPDTRFQNEFDAIKAAGGLVIRVERPNRPASGRDDSHVSETELDAAPFDAIIQNDANLSTLEQRVRQALLMRVFEMVKNAS